VQSSRSAISRSLHPRAASNTILARITSRYGRVYRPARPTSTRLSASVIVIAATDDQIRHRYGNSFTARRTYFRGPVLAD
jgi:hypothetical protein